MIRRVVPAKPLKFAGPIAAFFRLLASEFCLHVCEVSVFHDCSWILLACLCFQHVVSCASLHVFLFPEVFLIKLTRRLCLDLAHGAVGPLDVTAPMCAVLAEWAGWYEHGYGAGPDGILIAQSTLILTWRYFWMHHSLQSRILSIFLAEQITANNAKLSTRPVTWYERSCCRWFLGIIAYFWLHVFCMNIKYFVFIFSICPPITEDALIVTLLSREGNGHAEAAVLNRQFARQLTPPRHGLENAVSRNLYRRHRDRSRSRDRGHLYRWQRVQIANERVEKIALHVESWISELACFSVFKTCFLHGILHFFRLRCVTT